MTCARPAHVRKPAANSATSSPGGTLRRACVACGQQPAEADACAACRNEQFPLRRTTAHQRDPDEVPPIVHDVLRASGQPLDPHVRANMEAHFVDFSAIRTHSDAQQAARRGLHVGAADHPAEREAERVARTVGWEAPRAERGAGRGTFSDVRIHADQRAAESARAVNALAYTVGRDVVFGAGQYAPHTLEGRRLLAHELTHIVQQSSSSALAPSTGAPAVRRKVILAGAEMPAKDRKAFLKARKWSSSSAAAEVMEDMAAAGDAFDFADEGELQAEISKRLSTVRHMEESQQATVKSPHNKAFGYPFTEPSVLYGPRVNYAARKHWEPALPDDYAVRKDKAKNKALLAAKRSERCAIYGDMCGLYGWKLSAEGKKDPYHAIAYLFIPQPPHKRTLIHCDYLISLVNFLSLADSIGPHEFNHRVAAFGAENIVLKWNAFTDLHATTFARTASGDFARTPTGAFIPKAGLHSTQRVRPSSEADLVIGDHVVFFNHLAYDLINAKFGNAWRLENAVLVSKSKGKDVFLGHGSGYKTADEMREKLKSEFNLVARRALDLVAALKSKHPASQAAAQAKLDSDFPNVKPVGGEMHMKGVPKLLSDSACGHEVDEKLREIKAAEVLGPRSPCDPTKMNEVERPIESAK